MGDDLDVLARPLVAMAELDDGILTEYEELRLEATSPARATELAASIEEAFAEVPTPAGAVP